MTQSVELLLDEAADAEIRAQWDRLGDAGLPTSRRSTPSPSHAPHVTLWAGDAIHPDHDAALPRQFADLDLELVVGSVMLFGPRRGSYVLVRAVVPSAALLGLQQQVVRCLRTPAYWGFGAGRWTPHVTLARRVGTDQVGPALAVLAASPPELVTRVRQVRRWDSDAKRVWALT
ncbi:MAG TPA: 2'-5' RNA ligase family protein [Propionibacteriaceae bacterium]|nr:2'-5' RNA ligase family protein [Propionibacteriaceae bacterium]